MKSIFIALLIFLPNVISGRYYCKLGDINMRDNEINAEDVEFEISKFIF